MFDEVRGGLECHSLVFRDVHNLARLRIAAFFGGTNLDVEGAKSGDGVLVATKTKIFLGCCEGAFCVLWQHPATRTAAQGVAESVAKNPRRNVGRQHCVAVLY